MNLVSDMITQAVLAERCFGVLSGTKARLPVCLRRFSTIRPRSRLRASASAVPASSPEPCTIGPFGNSPSAES